MRVSREKSSYAAKLKDESLIMKRKLNGKPHTLITFTLYAHTHAIQFDFEEWKTKDCEVSSITFNTHMRRQKNKKENFLDGKKIVNTVEHAIDKQPLNIDGN